MKNVLIAMLMAVGLVGLVACQSQKPAPSGDGNSATTQTAISAAPGAAVDGNAVAVAPIAPSGDLDVIPLVLPKPRFAGTPKNLPPGTRLKPTKGGPVKAREDFKAPKGVKNVAINKAVTASDMEPVIGTLDLITDGSKEAVEDAYVELGPGVQWVQVDLGAKYTIYAVVSWHEHKDPRVYKDVVIQVADDKDFIENVQTVFSNDHDNSAGLGLGEGWEFYETNEGQLVDCKGVKARYVRAYANGNTADDLNRFSEIEVYALPAK